MAGKTGIRAGGFLEGITTLVEKLEELAEKGEQLQTIRRVSRFDDNRLKGVYGVNVRIGGIPGGHRAAFRGWSPSEHPPGSTDREGGRPADPRAAGRRLRGGARRAGRGGAARGQPPGHHAGPARGHPDRARRARAAEVPQGGPASPRSFSRRQMHTSCRNGVLEIRFTAEAEARKRSVRRERRAHGNRR